ncbi:hypothetical protein RB653_008785 [Dictyostelium firmibasis]|uniref:Uncharacterized protein n=1 Tax=Dictyostelium firmibasis TaxID=79012 RepID=A0AAN7YRW7_9MYCE
MVNFATIQTYGGGSNRNIIKTPVFNGPTISTDIPTKKTFSS